MAYNKIMLLGNICTSPELKKVGKDKIPMCRFCVAVDRPTADRDNIVTDFIYCTAWRETAKTVKKWFGKGRSIFVDGELHVDAVEDDNGDTKYYTTVNVNRISFTGQPKPKEDEDEDKPKPKEDEDEDKPKPKEDEDEDKPKRKTSRSKTTTKKSASRSKSKPKPKYDEYDEDDEDDEDAYPFD